MTSLTESEIVRRYRWVMGFFIFGLVVSGLTAFPLETELIWLCDVLQIKQRHDFWGDIGLWLLKVRDGLIATNKAYPWLAYGTDWLAFAHLMLAVFFIGPWRQPRSGRWILQSGMISCLAIFPLAFFCGAIRGIPLPWRLIDCSFGFFGIMPLLYCWHLTKQLETLDAGKSAAKADP